MTVRNLTLVLVSALLAAASYLGFNPSPSLPEPAAVGVPGLTPLSARPDLDRLIGVYEDRTTVSADPLDFRYLGRLYLAKAGLADDMPSYRLARASFVRARDLYPDDVEAIGMEAAATFALHDFTEAGRLMDLWLTLDPGNTNALALAGDIELAVGNVAGARLAYEELAQTAPGNAAVTARRAQLAAAEGDPLRAMTLAQAAEAAAARAGAMGPSLAWYQSFLGQLAFDVGDYRRSERHFAAALENSPGSAHDQAGIARARAAQGDLEAAIRLLELATSGPAAVDDLGYLGDLYQLAGRGAEAEATLQRIEDQLAEGTLDLEVHARLAATYFLDHDLHPELALELAEADLASRPDAGAWDTYAWALFKNGRLEEARLASEEAISSGVIQASFHFHAGQIARAGGDLDRAIAQFERALEISPRFHPVNASTTADLLETLAR